jgi:hypothetical protein
MSGLVGCVEEAARTRSNAIAAMICLPVLCAEKLSRWVLMAYVGKARNVPG